MRGFFRAGISIICDERMRLLSEVGEGKRGRWRGSSQSFMAHPRRDFFGSLTESFLGLKGSSEKVWLFLLLSLYPFLPSLQWCWLGANSNPWGHSAMDQPEGHAFIIRISADQLLQAVQVPAGAGPVAILISFFANIGLLAQLGKDVPHHSSFIHI